MAQTQLKDIPVGSKVYYVGSAKSRDGFFKVVEHTSSIWGESVDLSEVDTPLDVGGPRTMLGISPEVFDPSPNRRFILYSEWKAARKKLIAEMFGAG